MTSLPDSPLSQFQADFTPHATETALLQLTVTPQLTPTQWPALCPHAPRPVESVAQLTTPPPWPPHPTLLVFLSQWLLLSSLLIFLTCHALNAAVLVVGHSLSSLTPSVVYPSSLTLNTTHPTRHLKLTSPAKPLPATPTLDTQRAAHPITCATSPRVPDLPPPDLVLCPPRLRKWSLYSGCSDHVLWRHL